LLGLKKPVHVLQLGSSVRSIINMANIAVVDAQMKCRQDVEALIQNLPWWKKSKKKKKRFLHKQSLANLLFHANELHYLKNLWEDF